MHFGKPSPLTDARALAGARPEPSAAAHELGAAYAVTPVAALHWDRITYPGSASAIRGEPAANFMKPAVLQASANADEERRLLRCEVAQVFRRSQEKRRHLNQCDLCGTGLSGNPLTDGCEEANQRLEEALELMRWRCQHLAEDCNQWSEELRRREAEAAQLHEFLRNLSTDYVSQVEGQVRVVSTQRENLTPGVLEQEVRETLQGAPDAAWAARADIHPGLPVHRASGCGHAVRSDNVGTLQEDGPRRSPLPAPQPRELKSGWRSSEHATQAAFGETLRPHVCASQSSWVPIAATPTGYNQVAGIPTALHADATGLALGRLPGRTAEPLTVAVETRARSSSPLPGSRISWPAGGGQQLRR